MLREFIKSVLIVTLECSVLKSNWQLSYDIVNGMNNIAIETRY